MNSGDGLGGRQSGRAMAWVRTDRQGKGKNSHGRGEFCGVRGALIKAFKQNSNI
jgi:hypothetical protein